MAVREITTHPAQVLRRKAHKVTHFDSSLQQIIADMIDTMRDEPGVGLAAPQVNVPLKVVVVEYSEDGETIDHSQKLYIVVNPEITRFSEEVEQGIEGCLSIPGFAGEVERPVKITLKGQDRKGKNIKIKAEGWLARIFQHEIDHLNGILFIDRAQNVWKVEEEQTTQLIPAD